LPLIWHTLIVPLPLATDNLEVVWLRAAFIQSRLPQPIARDSGNFAKNRAAVHSFDHPYVRDY
jgi:hypothetical protein